MQDAPSFWSVFFAINIQNEANGKADGEWVSRSPQEILSSRVGNCYDTVKLQEYLLDAARVEHRMFLLVSRQSLEENRGDLPAHLFMLHNDNGVWRWVEGSWQPYRDNSLAGGSAEVLAAAVKRLMEVRYGMEYLLFPWMRCQRRA